MERHYPTPMPHLGVYYPSGYPPLMPPEAYQPRLHQLRTVSTESLGSYSDYDDPNRTMLPPQAPPRPRRRQPQSSEHVKHRRTRSGCYTCRQRRVKCDETHPVCERCRKGKRECTYPGSTSSSTPKPARSGSHPKGSPAGSSASESEGEEEEKLPLSAIPNEDEEDCAHEKRQSTEPEGHQPKGPRIPRETASSHGTEPLASVQARPQPSSTNSGRPVKFELSQSPRWRTFSKEVKFYLSYHRENLSHHHYAFKYDERDFLKTTFLEIAMNAGSDALLYSVVAFAAYHHAVSRNDRNISMFLFYYNKSIEYLQRSLRNKGHNVATLLTILQLATIEEFLGDWLNLLGHQKAAYQILTDLFTPQTIMQDETRRKIINWYIRFDIMVGFMSGGETVLDRTWFAAAADFYKRQTNDRPNDLGAKFEEYFATSKLLANDVTLLFAAKTKNSISDQQFSSSVQEISTALDDLGRRIETAFTDPSCFVKSFPRSPAPSPDDLFDYRDPNFLYAGELSTMNFVLTDHWAIELMFRSQLLLATGQAPTAELTELAIKKCKMFEAIQYGDAIGPTAILGCQASLGITALFLPREPKYTMWCRRKLTDIEKLGYIYPAVYRARMSELWDIDVNEWWLPDNEGYMGSIGTIRDFVEYRATKPVDANQVGVRDMNGIFRTLSIEKQTTGGTDTRINVSP